MKTIFQKSVMFIFFLVIGFGAKAQIDNYNAIQVIQQGNENIILSGLVNVNSEILISQMGDHNQVFTNNSKNLHLNQYGNQNYIGVADYLPAGSETLGIQQNGNQNSITSIGTNSIIENSIITQNGNGLQMTITNQ